MQHGSIMICSIIFKIYQEKTIPQLVPEQGELRIVNIDVYVAGLIQPKVKSSEETNEEAEEPIEAIETSQGQKMREMNVLSLN
jgi:hypothetical protein